MTLFFLDNKRKQEVAAERPPLTVKTGICVSGPFNVQKNPMLTPVEELTKTPAMSMAPNVPSLFSGPSVPRSFSEPITNTTISNLARGRSIPNSVANPLSPSSQTFESNELPILVCISPFEGESQNELSTHIGDTLRLLSKSVVNGWIFVQSIDVKDSAGWVPKDSVKVLDIIPSSSYQARSSSSSSGSMASSSSPTPHLPSPPVSMKSSNGNLASSWTQQPQQRQDQLETPPPTPLPKVAEFNSSPRSMTAVRSATTPPTNSSQGFSRLISVLEGSALPTASPFGNKISSVTTFPYSNISVHSVHCTNNRYWYRVDTLNKETQIHLCRFYQDFYDLQVEILENRDKFGEDFKDMPKLPNLISPSANFSQSNMASRCISLNHYLHAIVSRIRCTHDDLLSSIMMAWLDIRSGDFEHTSRLNDEEVIRLLEPKHLRKRIDFSSARMPKRAHTVLPQTISRNDTPNMSMDDLPTYPLFYSNHSDGSLESTVSSELSAASSEGIPPRSVYRTASNTSNGHSHGSSTVLNFKVLCNGDTIVLRLPRDTSFHDLKLRVAGQINKYLGDFQLTYRDGKDALFKPLRSSIELSSCTKDALRFGDHTVVLKVSVQ
ncbi:DEKNAAC103403 [Brettanomyces naardenensis]|uniref:DEKNAAC103403 n=1 Tax=Brettanomyces naardenensis TaxID=13370 RepID=A0A448YNU0_BRENA|nr:DEKNAAC103403 [Brettanomyces naardenensis]